MTILFNHEHWVTCPHCGNIFDQRSHGNSCDECFTDITKKPVTDGDIL